MNPIHEKAQFALIGIIFRPESELSLDRPR